MPGTNESVVERFAAKAIAGGAKTLKIEYDEGYEEVCALQGDAGVGIGTRIPSSSQEAKSLRVELYAMRKRSSVLRESASDRKTCSFKHSSRSRALKLSM